MRLTTNGSWAHVRFDFGVAGWFSAGSGLVQGWFGLGSELVLLQPKANVRHSAHDNFSAYSCCVEPVDGYGLGRSPEWAQLPTVVGPMFVLISVLRAGSVLVQCWFRAGSGWFNASIAAAKAIIHKGTASVSYTHLTLPTKRIV